MEDFVRQRITQLRLKKGVSEYQMSYDLGHSRGYINNITTGKALPSLSELFVICQYFGISEKDFFDKEIENPSLVNENKKILERIKDDDLKLVSDFLNRLTR